LTSFSYASSRIFIYVLLVVHILYAMLGDSKQTEGVEGGMETHTFLLSSYLDSRSNMFTFLISL
jgi:hypothetical protein